MKKIYFLGALLMSGALSFAQITTTPINRATVTNNDTYQNNRPDNGQDRAPGDIIGSYSDDFSSAANWTLSNSSSPAQNWTIDANGPAIGPAFASTTAANGFAWYDADAAGDGSSVDAQLTYNTVMDFSSFPAVAVNFESFYQEYQTQVFVEVSTNGLSGPWTQYEVHTNITDNGATANPEDVLVNISSQAGGQSNVAVRFNYVGGWGFFWQVDDFAMVEAYENELETTWAHFSSGTETNEYYMIPTDQITEITFGSLVQSNGVTTQTGVQMTAEVNSGSEYSGTSSQSVTLMEAQSDTFSIETPNGWTPSGAGTYNLVISTASDQTEQLPANNDEVYEPITVGGNVYARDNNIISSGFAGFISTQGDPIAVGNTFEIFSDVSFGYVDVGITTAAQSEGQLMYAAVYKWNGVDNFDYVTQSSDHTILNSELGTVVSLPLQQNVNAVAGDIFLICGGHYGGSDPVQIAQAQPTQEQTVLAVHSSGLLAGADPSAIVARINYQLTDVGIDEAGAPTGVSIYPNPADQSTLLSYAIGQEGEVSLTLTDLSGKVILTENYGHQVAGEHKSEISTAELSNGVYFYTLTVNDKSITKKFVVSH